MDQEFVEKTRAKAKAMGYSFGDDGRCFARPEDSPTFGELLRDEYFGQQTQTPHPSLPKGENMQDGSRKDEVEKRAGKGEDNKGGECL